jgi:MYXO-CTERM domain-containing protein
MSTIRCIAALLLVTLLLTAPEAWAQSSATSPAGEIEALEADLDKELAALSTADCALACAALESMSRSAERICQLAPGARCQAARDKVSSATRRVRDACPDCAAAAHDDDLLRQQQSTPAEPAPSELDMAGERADEDEKRSKAAPSSAPPAEDAGSAGCAACAIGQQSDDRGAALLLLCALGLALLRRRG